MDKIILNYQESDYFTYWIETFLFINAESIEYAYLEICKKIEHCIKENNINTNEELKFLHIKICDKDIPLAEFGFFKDNEKTFTFEFNLTLMDEYFDNNSLNFS